MDVYVVCIFAGKVTNTVYSENALAVAILKY